MAKKAAAPRPTGLAYSTLDAAHEFYNRELFGGTLPPALISYQRHAKAYGYFSGGRFIRAHGDDETFVDEIAMNPMHFAERTVEKTLSTLVHEMVHQWQKHHGREPSRCYHDRQWAAKMKEVGLHPSSTAMPGGKEVGPQVSHYILEGGPFATATAKFMKANETSLYQDRARVLAAATAAVKKKKGGGEDGEGEGEAEPKSKGRIKFQCSVCKLNAWAKPSAKLRCEEDDKLLVACESGEVGGEDDD